MMKILHMISNWKWTGPAEPAVNLCGMLSGRHETAMICGKPPVEGVKDDISTRCREKGIPVLGGFRLSKHLNPWANILDGMKLRKVLKQERFDLIHVHMQNDHLIAGLGRAGVRPSPKIVRTFYGAEGPDAGIRSGFLLRRFTSGAIAISEAGREKMIRDFGFPRDRAAVIPVGVDMDRFDPGRMERAGAREVRGLEPKHFVLGIVARMQRHRKFEVLLEAMRQAMEASPELRLLIVGRGTNRDEVAIQPVKALGLEHRILFTGYLTGDAYVQALAAMDGAVFLIPGSDGSCRAVREKMAMGLPVIATDIPPLNEMIVSGETGFLVECTVEGIRDAALLMVKRREETRRMGQKARERANEEFSLNVQASSVEHFYRQVLDASPRAGQETR